MVDRDQNNRDSPWETFTSSLPWKPSPSHHRLLNGCSSTWKGSLVCMIWNGSSPWRQHACRGRKGKGRHDFAFKGTHRKSHASPLLTSYYLELSHKTSLSHKGGWELQFFILGSHVPSWKLYPYERGREQTLGNSHFCHKWHLCPLLYEQSLH